MDAMQEEILKSLCRAYGVPCAPEQIISLDVHHDWGAVSEVVRVKYRDKEKLFVTRTAERRDGNWRETGRADLLNLGPSTVLDFLPQTVEILKQKSPGVWEAAGRFAVGAAPNKAPDEQADRNLCPHCGHETAPGPRCGVCRRHLD